MHYINEISNASGQIESKFDSMDVTLMGLGSLHVTCGPDEFDIF